MADIVRYFPEFLWDNRGALAWYTPERPVCLSMSDVVEAIGENHEGFRYRTWWTHKTLDPLGYMLRVTKVEDGVARDVTEDALIAYGEACASGGGEWPEELADLCPQRWKAA